MRPRFTHRFRVATVVPGPEDEVLARLAGLPSTIRARTIATTAGVVVTLEQERRGPLAWRRRTVRSLLRQLARVTGGTHVSTLARPDHITERTHPITRRNDRPAPALGRDHESTTSCP